MTFRCTGPRRPHFSTMHGRPASTVRSRFSEPIHHWTIGLKWSSFPAQVSLRASLVLSESRFDSGFDMSGPLSPFQPSEIVDGRQAGKRGTGRRRRGAINDLKFLWVW